MIKAGTFVVGLTSGIFLGIYLREQGYSAGLTRAYYAYKNDNYFNKTIKNKANVDDLFEYYRNGLLEGEQLEKFKQMMNKKNYDNADDAIINSVDKLLMDPKFDEIKRKSINRLYEGKN
jgi:hypothetical protein